MPTPGYDLTVEAKNPKNLVYPCFSQKQKTGERYEPFSHLLDVLPFSVALNVAS